MDEMKLLRELRAELPPAPAEVRARARGRLVAGIEAHERPRPRRLAWPRRHARPLAAAALAALLAAAVLALGVFDSGSRVETAAAKALRRTAAVAAADGAAALPAPGPGQFLYTKTKTVELEGWMPHGHQGTKEEPRVFTPHVGDPYPQALVPTVVETWTAPDGTMRRRETMGPVRFFSAADQRRWKAAGSPPPWAFDPRWHEARRDGSGRLVKEYETRRWAPDVSFPDPAELPTDPRALRLAVEAGRVRPPWVLGGKIEPVGGQLPARLRRAETIEKLSQVLEKPTTTAALRAAVFNALAEIPGIELERGVTDVAGRRGQAVVSVGEGGLRRDFSFDPATAELLARGETVVDPQAIGRAVPIGTPFRQIAYLRAGIVDSTRETAG